MAFRPREAMAETPTPTPDDLGLPKTDRTPPSAFSRRSLRQLGLFLGGAAFVGLSAAITRRAMMRRRYGAAAVPKFYQPSNGPGARVDGPTEALDALSIATVNVVSFGIMFTGGLLWALDISSLDDLRRRFRGAVGTGGDGRASSAEQEMEEWLATVLARKDQKERDKKGTRD
jgi:hypothetical protein